MDTSDFPQFYGDFDYHLEVIDEEERCAACSSFGSGLGLLSNDHEAETSYISTQVYKGYMRKTEIWASFSCFFSTRTFFKNPKNDLYIGMSTP